jgi:hypothetical protein
MKVIHGLYWRRRTQRRTPARKRVFSRHYGLRQNFELPNSRLMVHYSARHFRLIPDANPPTVEPDIMAPATQADFLAGRDPALDAAPHHPLQ